MVIRYENCFTDRYYQIVGSDEKIDPTFMDFGLLHLTHDSIYENVEKKERVFLLLSGSAVFEAGDLSATLTRESFIKENPSCLHVDLHQAVKITSQSPYTEIAVIKTYNDKCFKTVIFSPEQCRTEERGKGTMSETATRTVRTVFDKSNAPLSNLVVGEVVTPPGKWSSYPPHFHAQPEIYHYRFMPENGFGYAGLADKVFKIYNNDTIKILDSRSHPQVAAPGYVMFYIWIIRHLDSNPYIQPVFEPEHIWVMDKVITNDKED